MTPDAPRRLQFSVRQRPGPGSVSPRACGTGLPVRRAHRRSQMPRRTDGADSSARSNQSAGPCRHSSQAKRDQAGQAPSRSRLALSNLPCSAPLLDVRPRVVLLARSGPRRGVACVPPWDLSTRSEPSECQPCPGRPRGPLGLRQWPRFGGRHSIVRIRRRQAGLDRANRMACRPPGATRGLPVDPNQPA
jgi:hypothetical protein